MKRVTFLIALLLCTTAAWSQELLVFPVVTAEVAGDHGGVWATLVRVVKVNAGDSVTVRRKWVCLPGGGFVDDPATAPTWELSPWGSTGRLVVIGVHALLDSSGGGVGAVALELEGGEVLAHAYVADLQQASFFAFGAGQLVPALREPLLGPSHIPWLGGCLNHPCSLDPPERWNFFRNNIGIVNPNSEALTVTGVVIPFVGGLEGHVEVPDQEPETFVKVIPPYGWLQFRWVATRDYRRILYMDDIVSPAFSFVISLTPDKQLPYYAYASVVFTPDPASDVTPFNAPTFVAAEPGYVAPITEHRSR